MLNAAVVGGIILLALALGNRTVQIVVGILLILLGFGINFIK